MILIPLVVGDTLYLENRQMQIQPDYSHQLEAIAKALNRPSISQWEVALISALVGAFLGIAVQLLLKVLYNRWDIQRDIHKMRRVLYVDLLTMFQTVEYVIDTADMPEREERLRTFMKFDGEAYLRSHQDVYMQLPERGAAEALYAIYHRILDDKQLLSVHRATANNLLSHMVATNELRRRYIIEFLGRAEAKELLKRLGAIFYEYSERIGKMRSGTTEPMDGK